MASYVLAGGALTGKYGRPGRAAATPAGSRTRRLGAAAARGARCARWPGGWARRRRAGHRLHAGHPRVASTLFGATSPAQVAENVSALELLATLGEEERAELRAIGRQD